MKFKSCITKYSTQVMNHDTRIVRHHFTELLGAFTTSYLKKYKLIFLFFNKFQKIFQAKSLGNNSPAKVVTLRACPK